MKISTTESIVDNVGISMLPTSQEIRTDDHFILTETDKALASTNQGVATGFTIYSIATLVGGIVLNKSMK